jgi:hypothetical protein
MKSASTTIASTRSLSRPRAPVSAITAAAIVGEKLIVTIVTSATIATFTRPDASGAIGSHGHSSHATAKSPSMATERIAASMRVTPAMRCAIRSKFKVSPAISAMSEVAIPLMV